LKESLSSSILSNPNFLCLLYTFENSCFFLSSF
jgi:hypothetical protein